VHVSIQPVHGRERKAALAVARASALTPLERGIVIVGASVLSLIERGVPADAGLHLASAVAGAVAGEPIAEWETAVARALGTGSGQEWRVVAFAPPGAVRGDAARRRWLDRMRATLATPLIADQGDAALAVVPDTPALRESIPGLAAGGELVAVSAACRWPHIAAAVQDARRGLARARIAGSAPTPGLGDAVDSQAARAFSEVVLAPVWQARPRQAANLLATARTWLGQHGNWDATASALGVHRNTVRNRIAVLTGLLGRDLNDPDTRMELWFALRWVSLTD
jgi:hypothetical protein